MLYDMKKTNHIWIKENLVTICSGKEVYDIFKCSLCGIKGKSIKLGTIKLDGRLKNPDDCKKAGIPKKIKIKECTAMGKQFRNLKPGSVHKIIESPQKEKFPNGKKGGVWVMGIGEPVRVLRGEYTEVRG